MPIDGRDICIPFSDNPPVNAGGFMKEASAACDFHGRKIVKGEKKSRLEFKGLEDTPETLVAYRTFEGLAGILTKVRVKIGLDVALIVEMDGKTQEVAVNVNSLSKRLNLAEELIRKNAKMGRLETLLRPENLEYLKHHYASQRGLKGAGLQGVLQPKGAKAMLKRAGKIAEGLRKLAEKGHRHGAIHIGSCWYRKGKVEIISLEEGPTYTQLKQHWILRKEQIFEALKRRIVFANERATLGEKLGNFMDNCIHGRSKRGSKDSIRIQELLRELSKEGLRKNWQEHVHKELRELHDKLFGQVIVGWFREEDYQASLEAFRNDNQEAFEEVTKKRDVYGIALVMIEHLCGKDARKKANKQAILPKDLSEKGFSTFQIEMLNKAISPDYQERPIAKEFAIAFS